MIEKRLTTDAVLAEAANYVSRGWTRGSYATDAQGEEVDAINPAACRWCAIGAISAAAGADLNNALAESPRERAAHLAVQRFALWLEDNSEAEPTEVGGFAAVAAWNDSAARNGAEVAAALRGAAAEIARNRAQVQAAAAAAKSATPQP